MSLGSIAFHLQYFNYPESGQMVKRNESVIEKDSRFPWCHTKILYSLCLQVFQETGQVVRLITKMVKHLRAPPQDRIKGAWTITGSYKLDIRHV